MATAKTKTKVDKSTMLEQITKIKQNIDSSIKNIMIERDKLRDYVSDINAIVDDAEAAHDDLREAKQALSNAADSLSKYF